MTEYHFKKTSVTAVTTTATTQKTKHNHYSGANRKNQRQENKKMSAFNYKIDYSTLDDNLDCIRDGFREIAKQRNKLVNEINTALGFLTLEELEEMRNIVLLASDSCDNVSYFYATEEIRLDKEYEERKRATENTKSIASTGAPTAQPQHTALKQSINTF